MVIFDICHICVAGSASAGVAGLAFCHGKKYFLPGQWKKPVKTGKKLSLKTVNLKIVR
jgi:hypothetical protein